MARKESSTFKEKSFMSVKQFVDTNILVYAYDISAGDKHILAKNCVRQLWDSGMGVVSAQVLQELFVTLTKKIPKPIDSAQAKLIICLLYTSPSPRD